MLTFLRSILVRVSLTHTALEQLSPLARRRLNRAIVVSLLLPVLVSGTVARAARRHGALPPPAPVAAAFYDAQPQRKRIVTLGHGEMRDGARCTITSDAPLDDYKSYVEGERFYVLVPRAALATARGGLAHGRGFADMRVEERDGDVRLSFRLQMGATVAVNQSFNRLVIVFITNEEINRPRLL